MFFSFFLNIFSLSFVLFLCSCLPYLYPVTVLSFSIWLFSSYFSLFISVLPSVILLLHDLILSLCNLSLQSFVLLSSLSVPFKSPSFTCCFVSSVHLQYIYLFPDPSVSSSPSLALPLVTSCFSIPFFSLSSILDFTLIQGDMSLATTVLIGNNWSNESAKIVRSWTKTYIQCSKRQKKII